MRKLVVMCVLLAAFIWPSVSYGFNFISRVLVYKGSIIASNTVFNVNDANNFVPLSVQGYWVVEVGYSGSYAVAVDSNAAIYDKKKEWIKIIPNSVTIDPCDPCQIEMLSFTAADTSGSLTFDVTGKGKLTKDSNDPNNPKTYVATSMKGTGLLTNFDLFTPSDIYSGPFTVTLTLDPKLTFEANSKNYDVNETLNNIVDNLTAKGTWHNWPYLPAP